MYQEVLMLDHVCITLLKHCCWPYKKFSGKMWPNLNGENYSKCGFITLCEKLPQQF